MAVTGFVGYNGGGKTYALAAVGIKALAEDRAVFSNFGLLGAIDVLTWDDVLDVCMDFPDGGVLLLDELTMLCPARGHAKFPPVLYQLWTQSRKFGLDVYWSAQHQDFVDKFVRDVTSEYVLCSTFGGKHVEINGQRQVRPWLFLRRTYRAVDYGRASSKSLSFRFERFHPEIAASFDTLRLVELSRHLLKKQVSAMRRTGGTTSTRSARSEDSLGFAKT